MTAQIVVKTREQMEYVIEQIKQTTESSDIPDKRRANWRLMYGMQGTVMEEDQVNGTDPIYVTTRDISVEGLGFLTSHKLERGQHLVITIDTEFGDLEVTGQVVHSTRTIGGFKVGVRFDIELSVTDASTGDGSL